MNILQRNKQLFRAGIVCAAACLLGLQASYAAGPGTTACQFLKINPSARASAMANTYTAIADDAYAVYENPAGLPSLEKAELAATYLSYFADVKFGYIGYASQVRDIGVFGFGYTYLLVPDIDKRDTSETLLGTFNAKDTSIAVAFGRKNAAPAVLEGLDVGAALRIISSEIDQTIAYTGALDFAVMYSPLPKLKAALVLQNLGAGIKFVEVTDPLPLNLKLGLAYQARKDLIIAGQIDEYLIDNKYYASLGAEYWVVHQLAVRAGYRFGYHTASLGSMVGLGAGLGFRIWSAGLDYAYVPFGELGDTHRISLTFRF